MPIARIQKPVQVLVSLMVLGAVGHGGAAADTRVLGWPDLIPKSPTFQDPFTKLTPDQRLDLSMVAIYRARAAEGQQPSEKAKAHLADLTSSLTEQGIDVDELLARREAIREKRQAASAAVDTSLDKQNVRIPGFLLPLEFNGTLVTEFLLVPTVGACIHVPPPPPNQMVHVRVAEGFENEGLYTPVWVEGMLSVDKGQSELFLSDGAAAVSFGYRLEASEVTDYKG